MRKMLNEWRKFLDEGFGDVPPETLATVAAQKKKIARVKELALEGEILAKDIDEMDPEALYFLIVDRHDNVKAAQAIINALKAGDVDDIRNAIAKRNKSDAATGEDIYRTPYQKSATK